MHLRAADTFGDLSLGEVLEESKGEDGSVPLRQRGDQGTYRLNIEHLIQVGVNVAEGVADRSVVVAVSDRQIGGHCGVIAATDRRVDHYSAVDAEMIRDFGGVRCSPQPLR